ncbi:pyridoxal phosphatase [Utexia brackfieldae]|uniref:pyridoxal phosphatase n=1 Tax=Utexia brackfieldae TaxID=3074108 RepID=UPI00370D0BA5
MTNQAVAFDMDGTLLNNQRQILPETIAVIEKIKAKGIKVVLVTGRHHSVIYPYYYQLGLDAPVVCCNGTYLYDFKQQQAFYANPIDKPQATSLLKQVNEFGIHTLIYTDSMMCYEVLDDHLQGLFGWIDSLPTFLRPKIYQVDSFQDVIEQSSAIYKFATSSHDIPALKAFSVAVEARGDLECEWSWINRADVALKGNTKGNGLEKWSKLTGIPLANMVAFGDSYNDISMLERCGLGIAMGNADVAVQQKADRVIGHNNEPSLATVLTELFL